LKKFYVRDRSKTFQDGKLLAKYDLFSQIASDILNGQSSAVYYLELEGGKVFKGSMVERAVTTNEAFNSELVVDWSCPKSKSPFHFVWNLVADCKITNPESMDSAVHILSSKKVEGDWRGKPYVLEVVKDLMWSKKKGKHFYNLDALVSFDPFVLLHRLIPYVKFRIHQI